MVSDALTSFIKDIENESISVQSNISGSLLNTYRLGGILKYCVTLSSFDDIDKISKIIARGYVDLLNANEVLTIGKGSNILVSDNGFDGCVFLFDKELAEIKNVNKENEQYIIEVGAGCTLGSLARKCIPIGCGGLSFYVGIPGSVGGAVVMNAGGHGSQTSDVLISCNILNLSTGQLNLYDVSECEYSYRHSRFRTDDLVYKATFFGVRKDSEDIKKEIDDIVAWRRANQPGGRNVGSVFQNPQGLSAGSLIQECGLKGFRIGGAHVSEKHANFIQADEGAKACDVKKVINHIQQTVFENKGVALETEVRFVGEYDC